MTPAELREIRGHLGLSQAQMAERLGLGPVSGRNTIRAWERGTRPIPGPAQMAVKAMAVALSRVTMPARFIEDADDREFVRASLAECFGQLMDDSVTVWLPGDKQPA